MQVDLPFFEGPEDALRSAVEHLGGAKQVGAMLWGAKSPDAARTRLLDCLNPSRTERLDLSEAMAILKAAKEKGHHAPFAWICGEIGYEAPRALTSQAEVDRLTTVIDTATRMMATALPQLERLQRARVVA